MKITDVKVQCFRQSVPESWKVHFGQTVDISLVTLTTDERIEGYSMGRAVGGAWGTVLAHELISVAKRLVMDEDPLDREKIWQKLWKFVSRNRLTIFAMSCIDVALWDIAGKIANLPVYKLIGGLRDKVPAYASSGVHHSAEEYVEEALRCKERGYRAYKLHPPGNPEKDLEACRAVRKALGDEMVLMLDPTGSYDHREAMWVGRRLEELNFYWYEEPIGDFEVNGYAELCRALDIPVLAGEVTPGSVQNTAELILRGATDILRGDVYWKGGITGVMKMAHLAEAFGLKLELHHAASPIMNWANLHALGAFKNGDYLEILVPEDNLDFGLKQYARIDPEGFVRLPPSPGLGVEMDWEFVRRQTIYQS
ncbi:MAG: mandelate racemase [Syntrophaceae bacterium]|nr:mandelate racemase [Syntrophaceae bacterium]